jgi:hypothetical protein
VNLVIKPMPLKPGTISASCMKQMIYTEILNNSLLLYNINDGPPLGFLAGIGSLNSGPQTY